jgi:hypothetical protein
MKPFLALVAKQQCPICLLRFSSDWRRLYLNGTCARYRGHVGLMNCALMTVPWENPVDDYGEGQNGGGKEELNG